MDRIGFISDIHGNREALEAVLRDVEQAGVDALVCLGDVVGYGPDPDACLDLIASSCDVTILGNHDEVVLKDEMVREFHPKAIAAIHQTRASLAPGHIALIESMRVRSELDGVSLAHGSFGARKYDYLYDAASALPALTAMPTDLGAVGHTHLPSIFVQQREGKVAGTIGAYALPAGVEVELPRDARVIVNPGSVGQPRDRNPDASWGLLRKDRRTFEIRRVRYDVDRVQRRMEALGLPDYHGLRLKAGV